MKYHAIGFLIAQSYVNQKQNLDRDVKKGEDVLG